MLWIRVQEVILPHQSGIKSSPVPPVPGRTFRSCRFLFFQRSVVVSGSRRFTLDKSVLFFPTDACVLGRYSLSGGWLLSRKTFFFFSAFFFFVHLFGEPLPASYGSLSFLPADRPLGNCLPPCVALPRFAAESPEPEPAENQGFSLGVFLADVERVDPVLFLSSPPFFGVAF